MAYADLGGLGSKQGAPVLYTWLPSSVVPQVLPWLAILALLLLKPNRCARAWWIWAPLGVVAAVANVPQSIVPDATSIVFEMMLDWVVAMGFGLAALWLLASYLAWRHRILTWLGILVVQGGFSFLSYVVKQGSENIGSDTLALAIYLGASALVISLALPLAGLACRGRYGWLRITLLLAVALGAGWLAVMGTLAVLVTISSGGSVPVAKLLILVPGVTAVVLGIMLPFLVLAYVNGLYRERLKGLLHLGRAAEPPAITPAPPALAEPVGATPS